MAYNMNWTHVRPVGTTPASGAISYSVWSTAKPKDPCVTGEGTVNQTTWVSENELNGNGSSIKLVQRQINRVWVEYRKRGVANVPKDLTLDGIYGNNTDSAVRFYQGHAGLTVDGKVGSTTWSYLKGY